jgi:hypothetical protein
MGSCHRPADEHDAGAAQAAAFIARQIECAGVRIQPLDLIV